MEGYINYGKLKNTIELLDNFTGTVEPSYRKLSLYYDNSLKIYASDGCANITINFSGDFLPFEGIYTIPVQYLKGLLKENKNKTDDVVKISIDEKNLTFEFREMRFSTSYLKENFNVFPSKNFKILFRTKISEFTDKIDFTSCAASEGDLINIVSKKNKCFFQYNSGYFEAIAFFSESNEDFVYSLPYVTVRHILKSFSKIKKDLILTVGITKEKLIFYVPGIIVESCFDNEYIFDPGLRKTSYLENQIIDSSYFKNALNKMYTSFSKDNKAHLVLKNSESYIYKEENNTSFSWKIPYSFENYYLSNFHIRKIRSLLSRMSEKITLFSGKNYLTFVDEKKHKRFQIPVNEYKIN
ncbi:MAG: hypothetical protein H7A30_07505 [Thermotogae bacterium]|nr:hypothetical protein [Thermotogota bacterium]